MTPSRFFRIIAFLFAFVSASFNGAAQSLMKTFIRNQPEWMDTVIFPFQKMEYSYDDNGYKTGMTSSMWNKQRGEWRVDSKIEYFNDATGNHTYSLMKTLKATGWVNYSKSTFEYNAKGKLALLTTYSWKKQGDDFTWVNNSKTAYTYDENGNEVSQIYTVWRDGAWLDLLRTNYHSAGNQYSESWDKEKGLWVKKYETSSKSVEFHNNEKISTSSNWNAKKQIWVPSMRTTYTYSQEGRVAQNMTEFYDTLTKKWEPFFKGVFSYNEYGDQVRGDGYSWNAKTKTWNFSGFSTWEYEHRSKKDVSAVQIKESDILISPNPAQDIVTVTRTGNPDSENTITIFDAGGKMVKEFKTTGVTSTFSVKGMRPGTYTLDLVCPDENIFILKNLYVER